MESELKPCPFCSPKFTAPRICGDSSGTLFYVHCDGCGCDGPTCNSRAEAIAAWNERPNDAVIELAQKVAEAARAFDSERSKTVIGAVDNRNAVILAARALAALLPPKERT